MDELRRRAAFLSGTDGTKLEQEDVFFVCATGRLKLRVVNGAGQLIAYVRPDTKGPKTSEYNVTPVPDPDSLQLTLSMTLGIKGHVIKERWLATQHPTHVLFYSQGGSLVATCRRHSFVPSAMYTVGQTRVHCDLVQGLGTYMELEVVLEDHQTSEQGQTIADDLMSKLGIQQADLCSGAYQDMLAAKSAQQQTQPAGGGVNAPAGAAEADSGSRPSTAKPDWWG